MAVYRHIHIDYWQDGFVLDLTPEEKYFYIYLMTNSKTSQCGIYELPKRIIETETGYNRETVNKLLNRFVDYKKIVYCEETKEVFLTNWLKHNKISSPKVKKCIYTELKKDIFPNLRELQYKYPGGIHATNTLDIRSYEFSDFDSLKIYVDTLYLSKSMFDATFGLSGVLRVTSAYIIE